LTSSYLYARKSAALLTGTSSAIKPLSANELQNYGLFIKRQNIVAFFLINKPQFIAFHSFLSKKTPSKNHLNHSSCHPSLNLPPNSSWNFLSPPRIS